MAFSMKTKDKIFQAAHGHCERCDKQLTHDNHKKGERGAWEAHHRTAASKGGSDAPSNGEALCIACHEKTRSFGKHT